jgi:predicted RNase H-like HicB family nuclease
MGRRAGDLYGPVAVQRFHTHELLAKLMDKDNLPMGPAQPPRADFPHCYVPAEGQPLRPYSIAVHWSDEDCVFVARSPEWQWLGAHAATPGEAAEQLYEAIAVAEEVRVESGWPLPAVTHYDSNGELRNG